MQIDLEPRKHSHLYEIKPMSRWWLVLCLALSGIAVAANGWDRAETWALLFMGWAIGLATLLIFPRTWLSKLSDTNPHR